MSTNKNSFDFLLFRRAVLHKTVRSFMPLLFAWLAMFIVCLLVFLMYEIRLEPLIYAAVLSFVVLAVSFFSAYVKEARKSKAVMKKLQLLCKAFGSFSESCFNETHSLAGKVQDTEKVLEVFEDKINLFLTSHSREQENLSDYISMWVHQIKNPIASIKMLVSTQMLRSKDTEDVQLDSISVELFRIEEYVDQVLNYVRLNSQTNDLLIDNYSLEQLLRTSIKRFAAQFIRKNITFKIKNCKVDIATDKKWFCFILDQALSNALKYSEAGAISVSLENSTLCIQDQGCGISENDISRIFQKGFTGTNGRKGEKSTGLGLYLAKRAAEMLNIELSVKSEKKAGTKFLIEKIKVLEKT